LLEIHFISSVITNCLSVCVACSRCYLVWSSRRTNCDLYDMYVSDSFQWQCLAVMWICIGKRCCWEVQPHTQLLQRRRRIQHSASLPDECRDFRPFPAASSRPEHDHRWICSGQDVVWWATGGPGLRPQNRSSRTGTGRVGGSPSQAVCSVRQKVSSCAEISVSVC